MADWKGLDVSSQAQTCLADGCGPLPASSYGGTPSHRSPIPPSTLAWLQGHPGRSIPPECGLRAPRAGASWKQGSWMNLLVEACLGGDPGPNLRCQAQRWLEQVPGARASGSVWTDSSCREVWAQPGRNQHRPQAGPSGAEHPTAGSTNSEGRHP